MKKIEVSNNTLFIGSCMDILPQLPECSVQSIITSPPYWNLRDYGTAEWEGGDADCDHKVPDSTKGNYPGSGRKQQTSPGSFGVREWRVCGKCGATRKDQQIGQEVLHDCLGWATGDACGDCFVCHMVLAFRACRRVLRDDGTLVLNLGDSYANTGGHTSQGETSQRKGRSNVAAQLAQKGCIPTGVKVKDLIGIPWRAALALQADGWYLRSDIPWLKRGVMPESVQDRPSKSLEYVFLLTKSQDYYWDMLAVRRENKTDGRSFRNADLWFESVNPPYGLTGTDDELLGIDVTHEGNAFEHFATMPQKLIDPFVRATTSQKGCCSHCGCPYRRRVEKDRQATRPAIDSKVQSEKNCRRLAGGMNSDKSTLVSFVGNRDPQRHVTKVQTLGWEAGCGCNDGEPIPCIVLDPFAGVSTTGLVCQRYNRAFWGIELNEKYARLAERRLRVRGKMSRKSGAGNNQGVGGFGI